MHVFKCKFLSESKPDCQLAYQNHVLFSETSPIDQSPLCHKLEYNGVFLIFKWLLTIRNEREMAVATRYVKFSYHANISNVFVICSYSEYIRHYAPSILLLCCDDIKSWSVVEQIGDKNTPNIAICKDGLRFGRGVEETTKTKLNM